MKNGKTKINKTKLIARVMLVVLLFSSALNLAGCSISVNPSQVNKGQYYYKALGDDRHIGLMAISDSEEFTLDDISFQLYIGLHKKSYSLIDWMITDENELLTKTYDISEIADYDKYKNYSYVIYAYVYNSDTINLPQDDYWTNIYWDNAYVLREISYEESFKNGAYNFTKMPFTTDYHFNYSEQITIPKEYLMSFGDDEYGTLCIAAELVKKIDDGTTKYGERFSHVYSVGIGLDYHIKDDGTIILDFRFSK